MRPFQLAVAVVAATLAISATTAAAAAAAGVEDAEEEAEEFGPREIQPQRPANAAGAGPALGFAANTTTVAPTPDANGTTAVTTVTTTTTTLRPATYVHFAFFENQNGVYHPGNESLQRDNSNCRLSEEYAAGYFAILKNTGCTPSEVCQRMPGVFANNVNVYYTLALNEETANITTLRAFCPEGCPAGECRVERGPVRAANQTDYAPCSEDPPVEPIAYDSCEPTNPEYSAGLLPDGISPRYVGAGSWQVRQPALTGEEDFDVCVLNEEPEPNASDLITTLYMPKGCLTTTNDWDKATDAVHVLTTPVAPAGVCASNYGYAQQLNISTDPVSGEASISGLVDCDCDVEYLMKDACSCTERTCIAAPATFDSCTTSKEEHGTHVALVQTARIGGEGIPFLYKCKGMAPTHAPPAPGGSTTTANPATPGPTNSPSTKKAPSTSGAVLAAIIGGSIFFGLGLVGAIVMLRKRKMQRMAAYSALQDDPTF